MRLMESLFFRMFTTDFSVRLFQLFSEYLLTCFLWFPHSSGLTSLHVWCSDKTQTLCHSEQLTGSRSWGGCVALQPAFAMASALPECYHGPISKAECEELLAKKKKDGAYLIRDSETIQGAMCLCVLWVLVHEDVNPAALRDPSKEDHKLVWNTQLLSTQKLYWRREHEEGVDRHSPPNLHRCSKSSHNLSNTRCPLSPILKKWTDKPPKLQSLRQQEKLEWKWTFQDMTEVYYIITNLSSKLPHHNSSCV